MYNDDESEDYYERRTARADAALDLIVEWVSIAVVIGFVIYYLML